MQLKTVVNIPNNNPSRTPLISSRTPLISSRTTLISPRTPLISSRTPLISSRTALISSRTTLISPRTTANSSRTTLISSRTTPNLAQFTSNTYISALYHQFSIANYRQFYTILFRKHTSPPTPPLFSRGGVGGEVYTKHYPVTLNFQLLTFN